ncbi:ABC transporter substrate-binding protein [Roseobacter denitrificans]|uniref:ABC transporter, periplasmic substrate-binding protein, putative n=1 Tax=Roseobacter denitrificans (strain ATCC 33942 / OCh 114) TaxID=375451 RepID=Q16CG2_ROSDO|nr:ABC transporter substrate-binding protein [Roseobacter denitrificans]ABG30331.1 ABC transporter, periplasmic substrate-binding protein, putative [Roseobacter denitrificans OCh 114]AVL53497.1 ABC transporter substrate-binding protein [Roseobacter denitrificans]SFF71684.1 amino acid/amide ABC transporter substrate-binding protein, HAAT family [Roseobacter denitrificans OCh 114]
MFSSSFAHRIALSSLFPNDGVGMEEPINIGFLAPLTGPVSSWGLPGLHGCQLWAEWLNRAGGLLVGGRRYPLRILPYDCGYDPQSALEGARHLVLSEKVKLLMMLGGDTFTPLRSFLMQNRVLTSTLLPSDLSPDTPYLIAPSEVHPVYNVTGVDWLAANEPQRRRVAMCSQRDALGLPSTATYRAAFDAADLAIVKDIQYRPEDTDIAAIVQPMLDARPDILCWCTSYTPAVHAMTEYAFERGFTGRILSCTLDNYPRLIERTSAGFMEGTVFQFPDFDDPELARKAFFFNRPSAFFEEYNARYPGAWSAVSWEYVAILEIWHAAVERVASVSPVSVLTTMKQMQPVTHAFGPARWWGESLFGIDNALIGDWPVVQIREGKARIAAFRSIPEWLEKHEDKLREQMRAEGQLWQQRIELGSAPTHLIAREAMD